MIDYVFRYDPSQLEPDRPPVDAEEARRALIEGNRTFWEWMTTCRTDATSKSAAYVVPCRGVDPTTALSADQYPVQRPFATVLGCSDARVPTEMLFGRGFNDLFVVRVAGNVLGDVVQGSFDFSVVALSESVRVAVVLGHTNCGAVKGAVDAYLDPRKFWSKDYSGSLRMTFQRIFVAVRESDNAIREVWGKDAPALPGYREVLIDMGVCLNAAHTAYSLRQRVESMDRQKVRVLFGVYDVRTQQVCMPPHSGEPPRPEFINLADACANPQEITDLALELARMYRSRATSGSASSTQIASQGH